MRKFLYTIIILFLGFGCVQLYEFKVDNKNPSLVIEGQISNISFNEFKKFPADGRYFTVKLRLTSNVTNVLDQIVKNASVVLKDDHGRQWVYSPSGDNQGVYILHDDDFHAEEGVKYQLSVILADGENYNSDWEQMPDNLPGPMGSIDFEEVESQQYIYQANEKILTNIRSINVRENLPKVTSALPVYYKWDFTPTWIFRATLLRPSDKNYRCWITDPYYLADYTLHKDYIGDYKQDLVNIAVDYNDRFFDRLSILISQYSMSEKYYNYWDDIHEQSRRKGLFDPPPYNLQTNLHSEDPSLSVYGYFGVVFEQGKRWNFSRTDLSYSVENTWKQECEGKMVSPWDRCINCFNDNDYATNIKPDWWDK